MRGSTARKNRVVFILHRHASAAYARPMRAPPRRDLVRRGQRHLGRLDSFAPYRLRLSPRISRHFSSASVQHPRGVCSGRAATSTGFNTAERMGVMINSELLDRLEQTLCLLYGEGKLTDAIVRVLIDLRHMCDRKAASFAALDQTAQVRYLADIGSTDWTAEDILRNEG